MNINIVESSLNLRIERGKTKDDYTLHKVQFTRDYTG